MTTISQDSTFVKISTPFSVETPPRTLVQPNHIPRDLWSLRQWIVWRYVNNPKKPKPDKPPFNPRTLGGAGPHWPNTWTDIRAAVASYKQHAHLSGIGFFVTGSDPYTVVDLDDCLIDDTVNDYAGEIVDTLATYTEISPSGNGLRLVVRCETLPKSRKIAGFEVYSTARFATFTGNVYRANPIAEFDDLEWLIERYAPRPQAHSQLTTRLSGSVTADDDLLWLQIWDRNRLAYRLFHGDLSTIKRHGHESRTDDQPDQSSAVILLLNALAAATGGDAARMRRLMHQTRLDKTKWNQPRGDHGDWLDLSIENAIGYVRGMSK